MNKSASERTDTKECIHYEELSRALTLFSTSDSEENRRRQTELYKARVQCLNSKEKNDHEKVVHSRR